MKNSKIKKFIGMAGSNFSSNDFKSRIELAKLDLEDLMRPSQILKFNKEASDQEVTLLQLDKDLLCCIEAGDSLVIRGNADDSAVLCTDDATYDIKNASTSNTLILLDDCLTNKEDLLPYTQKQISGEEEILINEANAVGWKFNYLELKRIIPRASGVFDLLNKSIYKGPQHENDEVVQYMQTLSTLMEFVQASETEVMEFLMKINCCCINGKWRLLDFGYIVECMGEIFQLIEAESWSCGQIPVNEMCEKINDCGELVPNFIVKHLLGCYGKQFTSDEGTLCFQLDERKVSRFFAEMLLRDVGKFNLSEFMEVWKESAPAGMAPQEKFLQGLALIDRDSHQSTIRLFKVEDLPMDVDARFDNLFRNREKWTKDDIVPYIENICVKGQSTSSMLTKHARTSSLNGVKMYSTRKPLR